VVIFKVETTFERMGKGILEIDHEKEEYLLNSWIKRYLTKYVETGRQAPTKQIWQGFLAHVSNLIMSRKIFT
jgi:hypothetical protein